LTTNNLYTKFRDDYLKPYIEEDFNKYPFPHSNVSDLKYAAKYQDKKEEDKLFKLFELIKLFKNNGEKQASKQLIKKFYTQLDRKYNDQSLNPEMPRPEKVGMVIDRIVSNGIVQIGFWATGTNSVIYPWMVAGTSTINPTYGNTMLDVNELARVNVVTDNGFLDPMNDGWSISGGFVRGTPSGVVSEIATANTSTFETSKIFDRSVLPLADRIDHEQNEDSFTLSAFYVVTSI
jgi:hypothetical protein